VGAIHSIHARLVVSESKSDLQLKAYDVQTLESTRGKGGAMLSPKSGVEEGVGVGFLLVWVWFFVLGCVFGVGGVWGVIFFWVVFVFLFLGLGLRRKTVSAADGGRSAKRGEGAGLVARGARANRGFCQSNERGQPFGAGRRRIN